MSKRCAQSATYKCDCKKARFNKAFLRIDEIGAAPVDSENRAALRSVSVALTIRRCTIASVENFLHRRCVFALRATGIDQKRANRPSLIRVRVLRCDGRRDLRGDFGGGSETSRAHTNRALVQRSDGQDAAAAAVET
jgi:hypothetical protein